MGFLWGGGSHTPTQRRQVVPQVSVCKWSTKQVPGGIGQLREGSCRNPSHKRLQCTHLLLLQLWLRVLRVVVAAAAACPRLPP